MTDGVKFLVSALKEKNIKILSSVQKKWFDKSELKCYHFVMDYYKEHGEIMGVKSFCDKYGCSTTDVDSSPAFYLKTLKERYIFSMVTEKVPWILKGVKESPTEKLEELQELVSSLSLDTATDKDVRYSDDVEVRKKEYEDRVKHKGVTYLSMGCEDLDNTFFGYRKNDLITIGGKAGQGKTWIMVFLVNILESVMRKAEEEGVHFGDIMLITNEMGDDEIKERLDCLRFHLPYKRFNEGTLTERETSRYYRGLDKLKEEKSHIRIIGNCNSIDELSTLIGIYQPSIVFIDGSYLMESQLAEGWERVVYITRNLKRIAKSFGVPIVNTTQLKRGVSKSSSKFALDGQDDFAYSSSYTQDSDIALRMFQDADMRFHDLIGLEVVKGRRVVAGTKLMFQNDLEGMRHSITLPVESSAEPEVKTDY